MNIKQNIAVVVTIFIMLIICTAIQDVFAATQSNNGYGSSNFTTYSQNQYQGGGVRNYRCSQSSAYRGSTRFTQYSRNRRYSSRRRYGTAYFDEYEFGL